MSNVNKEIYPPVKMDATPPVSFECNRKTNVLQKRKHKACFICPSIGTDISITYHSFPKNNVMKQKWMEACKITFINNFATICSRHFTEADFCNRNAKICRLKKSAIPSKFLIPFIPADNSPLLENQRTSNMISESIIECSTTSNLISESATECRTTSNMIPEPAIECSATSNMISESIKEPSATSSTLISNNRVSPCRKMLWRYSGDIDTSNLSNIDTAKIAVDLLKRELREAKKRIISLQQYKRRSKQKLQSLQQLVTFLKKKLMSLENLDEYVLVNAFRMYEC